MLARVGRAPLRARAPSRAARASPRPACICSPRRLAIPTGARPARSAAPRPEGTASREVAISRQEASDLRAELEQLRTALEAEGKFPTGAATGMRLPSVAEVRESLLTPQSAALGSALGSSSSQPDSSSTRPGSVVFIAGLVVFTEPSRRRRTGRARRRRRWPGRTMSSLWPRRWLRRRRARHGARPQRPAQAT